MGDTFEVVVDVDANADEAAVLARTGLAWLVDGGVVDADPSPDCVLGTAMGYRPGLNYRLAVARPDDQVMRWLTNGMEVSTNRRVFVPTQG